MKNFEVRIRPKTDGPDAHIDGYTVEFGEEGGASVSVTLPDLLGSDFQSGNLMQRADVLVNRAKALMREVLEATGEGEVWTNELRPNVPDPGDHASNASEQPPEQPPEQPVEQPDGPPISSSQSEPELDDAPTVRVKGEGLIRPD
ncbi:hypothetical protein C5748_00325 [Phyllobacterium phragmitis]|uniref:Uncharacterized protein n=1 Tax=Phyllobacterium phragmitis TaxID=2670329 RepID=A0A2S9IYQ7_9HYPH|nr:hypothetical protein [Phyllobacterium phragmitis]PRD45654.1 hypothetical protein C5748_00325 [Phyllobacterium phragmitis]